MEFRYLESLDDAKALVDCVYQVYGLTFHREHIYHPDQFLELNRRGWIRSCLAWEGGEVVGHLAWIRPYFELQHDGEPLSYDRVGEVGLSIVRAEGRGKSIQTNLATVIVKERAAEGHLGVFTKCVTLHTLSQRTSARLGSWPVALFLGGIPKWVVYDDVPMERKDPLSTAVFYCPFTRGVSRPLCKPADMPWLSSLVDSSSYSRDCGVSGELEQGETVLEFQFQPSKHLAQVHVLHAGVDLMPRMEQINRWLMRGHIKHVTYFLPAGSKRVQLATAELGSLGIFPGGWIPHFQQDGGDVLVYQALAYNDMDLTAVKVHGEAAEVLLRGVAGGWRMTRERAFPTRPMRLTGDMEIQPRPQQQQPGNQPS